MRVPIPPFWPSHPNSLAMRRREIPPPQWTEFLDAFSRRHDGWLVTVEHASPVGRLVAVDERPLSGIFADGQERLTVLIGRPADRRLSHAIAQPVKLVTIEDDAGADAGLEIASADGARIHIRFRAPVPPEMVDGLPAA